MKLALLLPTLLLAGCTTVVPVTQRWPEPPGLQSMKPCAELKKLEPNAQLSDVAKTVAHNYTEYYTCLIKLEAWQEWYAKQEIIHKGLK
jgi:hypothetical protein